MAAPHCIPTLAFFTALTAVLNVLMRNLHLATSVVCSEKERAKPLFFDSWSLEVGFSLIAKSRTLGWPPLLRTLAMRNYKRLRNKRVGKIFIIKIRNPETIKAIKSLAMQRLQWKNPLHWGLEGLGFSS